MNENKHKRLCVELNEFIEDLRKWRSIYENVIIRPNARGFVFN